LLHVRGEADPPSSDPYLVQLAERLGRVEVYESLAPLEALFKQPRPAVRAAVLRAVRQIFLKRSFNLVDQGLSAEGASVRGEAVRAVGALHFGHGLDRLIKIYRHASDPEVRRVALESIGKVRLPEAAEMLLDVLCYGTSADSDVVRRVLATADNPALDPLLQR